MKRQLTENFKKRRKAVVKDREVRQAKIALKGKNPLDRLPIEKRAYVACRASGDSVPEAARSVEISSATARKFEEDPDVQKGYQHLIQQILPASRIAELIKGGTEATTDTYDATGEKLLRSDPDWRTRRPYIEMAAEHGGYFQRKSEAGANAPTFIVNVTNVGQEEPRVIDATVRD